MKIIWNSANITPEKQNIYLCYGDEYTPINKTKGIYYLAAFVLDLLPEIGWHWLPQVSDYVAVNCRKFLIIINYQK